MTDQNAPSSLPASQVSSDSLSTIKARAVLALSLGKSVVVDASAVLALVEGALALRSVQTIAEETREHWDKDRDMKVGKILIALSGAVKHYRPDIDKIHDALAKLEAL
jgi:hypothetical protein